MIQGTRVNVKYAMKKACALRSKENREVNLLKDEDVPLEYWYDGDFIELAVDCQAAHLKGRPEDEQKLKTQIKEYDFKWNCTEENNCFDTGRIDILRYDSEWVGKAYAHKRATCDTPGFCHFFSDHNPDDCFKHCECEAGKKAKQADKSYCTLAWESLTSCTCIPACGTEEKEADGTPAKTTDADAALGDNNHDIEAPAPPAETLPVPQAIKKEVRFQEDVDAALGHAVTARELNRIRRRLQDPSRLLREEERASSPN